jgi:hypothetical protein
MRSGAVFARRSPVASLYFNRTAVTLPPGQPFQSHPEFRSTR